MTSTHHLGQAPRFSAENAARIAEDLYGLRGAIRELPSERDQNFLLESGKGRFVLKIANTEEPDLVLEVQNLVMERLSDRLGPIVPRVLPSVDGSWAASARDSEGSAHRVRMVTWLSGEILADTKPHSPGLLRDLGAVLGRIDRALKGFSHPGLMRPLKWDPSRACWIEDYVHLLPGRQRAIVEGILEAFRQRAAPAFAAVPWSAIHNDANDHNVLVEDRGLDGQRVSGLIDFGDMVHAPTVCELSVACAYAMLGKPDPVAAAASILEGFHNELPLTEPEVALLWDLIRTRLGVSVVNSAWQRDLNPDNRYLQVTDAAARELLSRMDGLEAELATCRFRQACGWEPCPGATRVRTWLTEHSGEFGPVLGVDPRTSRTVVLDLGVGSLELGNVPDFTDCGRWTKRLFEKIAESGAALAIGRYNEARPIYTSAGFAAEDSGERRTVHLGVDLFVQPGEPVLAPLDGKIHSFQDNRLPLDYGPAVILEHEPEPGFRFWTLYGHLSRSSLERLAEGSTIAKGDAIGWIGDSAENGGWPPHLHFQIVCDLLGRRGDFPGVAAPGQRETWLSLSPDPGPILGVGGAAATESATPEEIVQVRRRRLGKSLSLSYRRPLKIVRGFGQYLFDHEGQPYLDCVNNVAHVGHCHPRVVEAGNRQAAVLNTNTRYLHERLASYAERLCGLFPDPLNVCFLVCSGSEANELALRLAMATTGSRQLIVLEGGYHGNTSALVDVSSYKFDGPGGRGAPGHVRKACIPDPYRGRFRDPATAGSQYAAEVAELAASAAASGEGPASFLYESILGCGGQIVPPRGYLEEAHRAVRRLGGVCIADEVQVGFGRVGSHWWAFERQGVVPDIVTLGKPIGNGHPMGAVVTTREIADAFANGMEYFNTFGGNPVSCAIGEAVLDVVQGEGLRENALETGGELARLLTELKRQHPLIGDVRGAGLFLGVELVRCRESLRPAPREAAYVVERMRDHAILLSTDGPLHNVIKIKPPLVFSRSDALRLTETLDRVLGEDFARVAPASCP